MLDALHPDAKKVLTESVNVVGELDLIHCDYDIAKMYTILAEFSGKEFGPRDRLVILQHDTDYYPSMDSPGNIMFNLVQMLGHLDVSTDHCILLTASLSDRVQHEVNKLCDLFNLGYITVVPFSFYYVTKFDGIEEITVKPHKNTLFNFLNGVPRTHRKTMYAWLEELDLVKYGALSWHHDYQDPEGEPEANSGIIYKAPELPIMRTTVPFSRINETLSMSKASRELQIKHSSLFNKTVKAENIFGGPNSADSRWRADYLQDSLVYLISETVGDYPYPFLSEKTWKAMVSKTPFIMASSKGSLQVLRDLGFRTFNSIWSEEYDNKADFYSRAREIAYILYSLKDRNWDDIFKECIPILEHNYKHLQTFKHNELGKLKQL